MHIQNNDVKTMLKTEYGVNASGITPVTGGWCAAYRVDSGQGAYFMKVYDKRKSGTGAYAGRLDLTMAAASWLESNTELRGRINAPMLALNGEIKCEDENHVYLLFDFIDGARCERRLSKRRKDQLAEIVALLHAHGRDIPLDLSSITEDFTIPCDELIKTPPGPDCFIYQYRDDIARALDKSYAMAEYVKSLDVPFVLCHTDIHGYNLMWSDRLILIDWESIKFAPPEADLNGFYPDSWSAGFWGDYWDSFLSVYRERHPGFTERTEVLRFYQLRRQIEDVNEFYREYLYDDLTADRRKRIEFIVSLNHKSMQVIMGKLS